MKMAAIVILALVMGICLTLAPEASASCETCDVEFHVCWDWFVDPEQGQSGGEYNPCNVVSFCPDSSCRWACEGDIRLWA